MARKVAGDRAQVSAILPPGSDPHTFEPTPRDAQAIRGASLVVLNGAGLEPRSLVTMIQSNKRGPTPLIQLAEGAGSKLIADADGDHDEGVNPHCWLDPDLAIGYVERIRDGLIQVDAGGASAYRANAATYVDELRALDRDLTGQLAAIPAARRKLVTYHDAYAYFARKYGFEQVGFVLRSPGREPTAAEIAELVGKLRASGVPTVFAEPQLNHRLLDVAAAEAGVKVGTLYSDALDDKVGSYTALMRFNAAQLVQGLR
jgi:zinc/manganese transport system substrate-binding protein/manganese/iron transport system substrate-binding protein